jgi:hypothetical protein
MRKRGVTVKAGLALLACACAIAACAAESSSSKMAPGTTTPGATGEPPPATVGAARSELAAREHDVEMAGGDCEKACKALASLERAANHLCALSEPDECADARARVDRARRAVTAQCGSC